MKKLDMFILVIFITIFVLSYQFIHDANRNFYLIFSAIMSLIFIKINISNKGKSPIVEKKSTSKISSLSLLDENNEAVAHFEIYGKVGLLLGKDKKNNAVDINLTNSNFAATIDYEHAVMNYASGAWYIEDLYSANGVAIQKKEDGKKYDLSQDKPCKVDLGDIIYIGLTKLLVR